MHWEFKQDDITREEFNIERNRISLQILNVLKGIKLPRRKYILNTLKFLTTVLLIVFAIHRFMVIAFPQRQSYTGIVFL